MRRIAQTAFFGILPLLAQAAQGQTMAAPAANVLEQSSEYRFQLDLHVNDAALAKLLPAGWEPLVATTGAAKDANLRLIFVDCVNITGPDSKSLGKGTNRLAILAAPVRKGTGGDTGQMVLGGISEETSVPDGFGVYLKSSSVRTARSISAVNGVITVSEDWDFAAASGEHLQLHVKYTHGAANKGGGETKFYNPADPARYQIIRTEQATDITRNVTTMPPDRVVEFSYKGGGGKFAALFDGSEKPLSWDSQPVYIRTVIAP